jgi:2-C-methyl-D-erythritol 2,4-cyclodiphosphate synthase
MRIRVGQGFDVHAFAPGDHVMLGGQRISHTAGLAAHSDGDVALHALCDALLGAAALGDIGLHFPPGEAAWAKADSRDLLRRVRVLLDEAGWSVINTDLTIICEAPRIRPHADFMRANIAAELGITPEDVSVKATTTEKLGLTGRGEGIAANAVVLIQSN